MRVVSAVTWKFVSTVVPPRIRKSVSPASQRLRLWKQSLSASATRAVSSAGSLLSVKRDSFAKTNHSAMQTTLATVGIRKTTCRPGSIEVVAKASAEAALEPAIRMPTTVPTLSMG